MPNRLLAGCFLTLLLIACGSATGAPASTPAGPPAASASTPSATSAPVSAPVATATSAPTAAQQASALWIISGEGPAAQLVALDLATGKELRSLPVGVTSRDWAVLYTAAAVGGRTTVWATDLATGKALRSIAFDGDYRLPTANLGTTYTGLSYDGHTLVLAELPGADQAQADAKSGKPVSRFAILDTAFTSPPKIVALPGRYSYDALAPDGHMLYLIESQASQDHPARYGVRAYNRTMGQLLDGYVVDKAGDGPIMEGYAGPQVGGPGGAWVFTLYTNATNGPFIHALNVADTYALCLDLPTEGKGDRDAAPGWSLVLGRNGGMLYAVNPRLGQVAEVDVATGPRIRRTATIPVTPGSSRGPLDRLGGWLVPSASAK